VYQVLANADTPEDAIAARQNGAQGIGLCRTEHMVQQFSTLCYNKLKIMNALKGCIVTF